MTHIIAEFRDGTSIGVIIDKPYEYIYIQDVTVALKQIGYKNTIPMNFYRDMKNHE